MIFIRNSDTWACPRQNQHLEKGSVSLSSIQVKLHFCVNSLSPEKFQVISPKTFLHMVLKQHTVQKIKQGKILLFDAIDLVNQCDTKSIS